MKTPDDIRTLRRRYASGVHPKACECVRWAMWGPADLDHINRTGHHPNCPLCPKERDDGRPAR